MTKRKRPSKKGLAAHLERGLLSVVLSIVSLLLMVLALATESLLLMAVTGLSVLATAAQIQMARKRAEHDRRKAATRPPRKPAAPRRSSAETPADKARPQAAANGVVLCTETKKPIDVCECASRHVATTDGARRYGLAVGAPMGRRAKQRKPSMTKSSY